jgi:F-type H+-transporting ATPase subunit delta
VAKGLDAVAHVYATALLELAFTKGVPAEVLRDMRELGRIFHDDPKSFAFLVTPHIRKESKRQVIDRAFGGRVSEIVQNFIKVVVDKGRAQALPDMVRSFIQQYHERQGELMVKVATSHPLEDEQRDKLRGVLKKKFASRGYTEIVLEERVEPRLLGGMVVRTGDNLYDNSLRTRLNAIGERLRAGRLKVEESYED